MDSPVINRNCCLGVENLKISGKTAVLEPIQQDENIFPTQNFTTTDISSSEEDLGPTHSDIIGTSNILNSNANLTSVLDFENTFNYENSELHLSEVNDKEYNTSDNSLHLIPKKSKTLATDLRNYALENNLNHTQLRNLLLLLRQYHPELPKDGRTLLGTKRNLDLRPMTSSRGNQGKFIYFGVKHGLEIEFRKGYYSYLKDKGRQNVEIILNVDGIPIFKSSSTQFWPNCGKIFSEEIKTDVFEIAIYVGDSKPQSLEEYLSDFVSEINILHNEGYFYNNERFFVKLRAVSSDSPARAFLKNIKSHNSRDGCEFCNIQGQHLNSKILYISNKVSVIERRTDESFRSQTHKNHHLGISPLIFVQDFDIIKGFVLDYMHMACLGTMRRLVNRWLKSDSKFCIRPSLRKIASSRMCMTKLPNEFNRKMRSFTELDRFKATEYRTLILYIAPFIFKDLISKEHYNHFLLLYCAMRICCSKTLLCYHGHNAVLFIREFVKKSQIIYDNEEPVYNTHSLIHMVENAVESGVSLEEINCFPFENHLGKLKRLIRGHNLPLEQVVKRIFERSSKCLEKYGNDINEIAINSKSETDKYVLLNNNKIMVVDSLVPNQNDTVYKGQIYQITSDAFSNPVQSRIVKVWKVENLSTHLYEISAKDISQKCILIQHNTEHFIVALLH